MTRILKMHLSSNNTFGIKLLIKKVICFGLSTLLTFQISKWGIKNEMWPSNSSELLANSWMPILWCALLIKSLGRWQLLQTRDNDKLFSTKTTEAVHRVYRPIFFFFLENKEQPLGRGGVFQFTDLRLVSLEVFSNDRLTTDTTFFF